jgi:hypothetical protein
MDELSNREILEECCKTRKNSCYSALAEQLATLQIQEMKDEAVEIVVKSHLEKKRKNVPQAPKERKI